jgi:hypothetical protein
MKVRKTVLIRQEIFCESGRDLAIPTVRVAACAVLVNPHAGRPALDDFTPFIEASVRVGERLTAQALDALRPAQPRGYGKAALVGTAGDLEQGASMIHVKIGLAMRRGAGGGPALIPGNAKVGAPGASIDVIFGGLEDAWDYGAMDTMTIAVEDAPKPDEILLAVAFLAGGRPNARIAGASSEQVAEALRQLRKAP